MMSSMTQETWTQKRIYTGAGLLAIAGLAGAGWFGYSWYMRKQEQAAYKDLAESIDGYAKIRGSGASSEKWLDVERGFETGVKRHSSSKLQPYFLIFEADALVEQGKQKEAIALLEKAVGMISRSHPLYHLYAIKRSLMKIDAADEATQKQGRQELIALAKDTNNPMQDMARYYSGLDALSQGDTPTARGFFQEISAGSDSARNASVWFQMAQEKLRDL